jgi:hypothetical protein
MPDRILWIVCSRAGQYRRTKQGPSIPHLREDEHAYRVILPRVLGSREIVTLRPDLVAP